LELIFDVFKTCEDDGLHNAKVMSVVVAVLVVIAHDTAVIVAVQRMVDVRKVVTSYATSRIDPNLTPKLAITAFLCDVVRIIDDLLVSHEGYYHGCLFEAEFR
jgi:hypothetical protein